MADDLVVSVQVDAPPVVSTVIEAGVPGPPGPPGPPGEGGGTQILTGLVPPVEATGDIGDFYLDQAAHVLYGPKTDADIGLPESALDSWAPDTPASGGFTLGTVCLIQTDCLISALRFWRVPTNTVLTRTLKLWNEDTNTLLATSEPTTEGLTEEGWITAQLATPYPVTSGLKVNVSYVPALQYASGHMNTLPDPLDSTLYTVLGGAYGSPPNRPDSGPTTVCYSADLVVQGPAVPWPVALVSA